MLKVIFSDFEKYLLINLGSARQEIKAAVCWLTNPKLFNLLLERKQAGVAVEIILSDDRINFSNPEVSFQNLIEAGGVIRVSRYPHLMHHKFCIIDQRLLFTGSYNWTRNAENNNLENMILTTEKTLVDPFLEAFADIQRKTEMVVNVSGTKFHDYTYTLQEAQSHNAETSITVNSSDEPTPTEEYLVPFFQEEVSEEMLQLLNEAELAYRAGEYSRSMDLCEKVRAKNSNIAETYVIMASVEWRKNNYEKQVEFAKRAKSLDPGNLEAYNLLGIGYARLTMMEQSISHYDTCLKNDPDNYTVLLNRAVSFIQVETNDSTRPESKRYFKEKANIDLEKIIELTGRLEDENRDYYRLYYIRGLAKYHLGLLIQAKPDLLKALALFEKTPPEGRDIHDKREAKDALKDIEYLKKTGH